MSQRMPIGTVSRLARVRVATIRYYEGMSLLPVPSRTDANRRSYDMADVRRLRFIRRARDLGFSLDQIRALLDIAEQRDRSCEAVDVIARDHLDEVDRKIADLQALRRELDFLIGQCRRGKVAECRIIEALAPASS